MKDLSGFIQSFTEKEQKIIKRFLREKADQEYLEEHEPETELDWLLGNMPGSHVISVVEDGIEYVIARSKKK